MKNIKYFDILKNASLITWKNKFLWFFGFLIMLGSISSNLNINNKGTSNSENEIKVIAAFVQNNPKLALLASLVLVVVVVVLFLLRIMASAGIVKSVNDINLYRQLSIISILKESKKYLGRLIGVEIIIGFSLVIVGFVLSVPVLYLFALKAKTLAILIMILAISIALPLIVLAYYLIKYASFYIILTNERIKVSIELAYTLFAKNMKEGFLMTAISIAVSLLLVAIIILIILPIAIIFAPLGFAAYLIFAKMGATLVFMVSAACYGLIVSVTISWYEAFLQTSWLLFFQQIAFEKHGEKKLAEEVKVEVKMPSPEVI